MRSQTVPIDTSSWDDARPVATLEELNDAWRRLSPAIMEAVDYADGTHDEADLLNGIRQGDFHLWVGERSAVLTEFVEYPRLRALRFFLAGGDLGELREMEAVIASKARGWGVKRLEIGGRPGWKRALPGYRQLCVYLVKDI